MVFEMKIAFLAFTFSLLEKRKTEKKRNTKMKIAKAQKNVVLV